MRTTVTLDDDMVEELKKELEIEETSALVRRAMTELRQRIAAERLAALGGTMPDMWAPSRRRPPDFINRDRVKPDETEEAR